MFTGIVDHVGRVVRKGPGTQGGQVVVVQHEYGAGSLMLGESIAHDGVCLTVTRIEGQTYWVDAGPETLARTTLGDFRAGRAVNLERAATLSTRLGGHLVQGHVDGVGRIIRLSQNQNAWDLDIEAPAEVLALVIPRGSVTVDGISLTVTGRGEDHFSISVIPHTWQVTSLAGKASGASVNVEVDLIARYVSGLLGNYQNEPKPSRLTESFLREHGFG